MEEKTEKEYNEKTEEKFETLIKEKYSIEKEEHEDLKEAYKNIIDALKKYCDLNEDYYNIIALWIIGTYFHNDFPSYPYLFINAMKGSGKTRLLKLITYLSKGGELLGSLTEAVLFRTTGTLGIDEFEGLGKKGRENLRELLNASYKKGVKVKRLKKVSQKGEEKQVIEEFDIFRPIVMANIWGMENVLGDRCIQLILEKSSNQKIINLIEIFDQEKIVIESKKLLNRCSLCSFCTVSEVYKKWNNYIINNNTNTTNTTNNTNNTNYTFPFSAFKKLKFAGIDGRDLELAFPLLLIATSISNGTLNKTTLTLKSIFQSKKEEEFSENRDISLIDFVSQFPEDSGFNFIGRLVNKFKAFLQSNEEWLNTRWMGRALKRLNLIKEKRRLGKGVEMILDIKKAQNKMRMFR